MKNTKMNPVVHFEMPFEDKKRMSDFYSNVFGWKTQMMGSDFAEYVVVSTTETDEKTQRPKVSGAINGGFFKKEKSKPDQIPSVVISVNDIKEHMKMVKEAGGEVLGEPVEIPTIGWYVSFRDTEGNRVSLLQPAKG